MERFTIFEKQLPFLIPMHMICVLLVVIVVSCGDQSSDSGNTATNQPASASFSILWQTHPADRATQNTVPTNGPISDDCAGVGVATVECMVYDGASMSLLTTGSWDCSETQGDLYDIPPGPNRQFVVVGLDDSKEIVYRGQAANSIDFNPGQFVDVGYIEAFPFAASLPDTGQTQSFTDTYGEDSDYTPRHPHLYTKLDDAGNVLEDNATEWAMVRDEVTGLTWEVKTDDGGIHDVNNKYTWQDAQDFFIVQLNNDNFGGHSDWRVPTVKELSTLIDKKVVKPAIDLAYFPRISFETWGYWASTNYLPDGLKAWLTNFMDGDLYFIKKSESKYACAVRGAQINSSLVDNGDGTVTDMATGLMWKQDESGAMTWEKALAYCENLNLAGYSDWRLPNVNELQSIVDYNAYEPAIDTKIFPGAMSKSYWSSTTFESDDYPGDNAWDVSFADGNLLTGSFDKSSISAYVRPVRYADPNN